MSAGGGGGGYYGMIINAIGGAAQSYAAWKEQEAVQRALKDEMERQGKYAGQEYTAWSQGVQQQGSETAQDQMVQAQRERAQGYSSMEATPLTTEGALGKRFNETGTDRTYSAMRAGERAKLLSYGDWAHVQNVAKMRTSQDIAKIQDVAEGDARVFPYIQWNAQHKMDQLAGMGAMLQGSSNMGSYFSTPNTGSGAGGVGGGGGGSAQYPSGSEGDNGGYGYQPFPNTGINYYVPINNQEDVQNIPSNYA